MSYGFPSSRHLMKIKPFVLRLNAAKGELLKAIEAHNRTEIVRGIEDVGFWTGRTIAELISASEAGLEYPSLFRQSFASLYSAQEVLMFGKKTLMEANPANYGQPSPTSSSPLPTTKWEWVKAHSRPLALAGGLIGGPLIVGVANRSSSMEKTLLIQSFGALITLASLYYMTQTHDYQLPNQ